MRVQCWRQIWTRLTAKTIFGVELIYFWLCSKFSCQKIFNNSRNLFVNTLLWMSFPFSYSKWLKPRKRRLLPPSFLILWSSSYFLMRTMSKVPFRVREIVLCHRAIASKLPNKVFFSTSSFFGGQNDHLHFNCFLYPKKVALKTGSHWFSLLRSCCCNLR